MNSFNWELPRTNKYNVIVKAHNDKTTGIALSFVVIAPDVMRAYHQAMEKLTTLNSLLAHADKLAHLSITVERV